MCTPVLLSGISIILSFFTAQAYADWSTVLSTMSPDHVGPLFTDCWRISRGSDGPWPRVHVGVLFGANGIRLRSVLLEVSATPSNHPGERVGPPLVTLRQSMHRMHRMHRMNRAFHTCHDITGCMKNPSSFQMVLDEEGELTTKWRTFPASSTHGALSYLEASKMLMDFQNSINGMGHANNNAHTQLLKVSYSTTVCKLHQA